MNPNPLHFLYAAYIVTWAIHGVYLIILARKAKKIRQEMEMLKK